MMKQVIALTVFFALCACSGGGSGSAPASGSLTPVSGAGSPVAGSPSAPASPAPATPVPTASPKTPAPTATVSPQPAGTITPAAVNAAYDPPAGTFPNFPSSIFLQPLSNPSPNPSSSAWISKISPIGFGPFQFQANANGLSKTYMFPIYQNNNGPGYKIHCTEPWGTCALEGKTIRLLPGMLPETGTSTGCKGDCHLGFINDGYEYDMWATQWPPNGTTLDVGWGGICPLSGPGYSSCASTATGTALSLGIVRVSDLLLAAKNGGTLPYALQTAVKCSDGHVAPFTGSDGHCSGGPPQGERAYLALHDADINATSLTPIAKAILRTIDEDHYGLIITDTNGGASGFSLQSENDNTYTSVGLPGPWVSQFVPEAKNEGLSTSDSDNLWTVGIPFDGIDFQDDMKFL